MEFTQDAYSQRMERGNNRIAINDRSVGGKILLGECHYSLAHLRSCLVGKGDREDVVRCHTLVNEVDDTMRDDAGFTGASACQDEQRSVYVLDSLFLWCVETV